MTNSNNINNKLDPDHPLAGFESLIAIDPTTGVPIVMAFAPRTQTEVESRQWFWNEMRRIEWNANRRREGTTHGRLMNVDGTDVETRVRYGFDGKDKKPRGKEPRDV